MGLTSEALKRLRDAVGDDDLIIADILQSFVDEVDGLLDKLPSAAATNDMKTLGRIAHTLKSSCRDLGDKAAGDLCAKLEGDTRGGEILETGAAIAMITDACLELKSEVISYLNQIEKRSQLT